MYCYHCMQEMEDGTFCHHCMKENIAEEIPHHLRVGSQLNGRFLVGNAMGENTYGITYAARDETAGERVVLREFFPSGYGNRNHAESNLVRLPSGPNSGWLEVEKEHFLQQARDLIRFANEPALVTVRDAFEENDTAYLVMEYLEGIPLEKFVTVNGCFEPEEMFRLMLPVMESLAALHDSGIVHGTICPDHLLFTIDGSLKLIGFGSLGTDAAQNGMAQDVYGCCAAIYQCITGMVPQTVPGMEPMDPNAPCRKPSELGVNIPPELEKVLMYGMSPFPENDCPGMRELVYFINQARNGVAVRLPEPVVMSVEAIPQEPLSNQGYAPPSYPPPAPVPQQQQPEPEPAPNHPAQPEFYDNPNKKKKKKILLATLIPAGVLVAAAAAGAVWWFVFANHDPQPSVDPSDFLSSQSSWRYDHLSSTPDGSEVSTPSNTVEMIPCVGKNAADVQRQLERLGLEVDIREQYSADVPKGYVITQDIEEGQTVVNGSTVLLTISKGKDESPEGYNQKLVLSAPQGSSSGVLTLYEWSDGDWKSEGSFPATLGALGIRSDYGEGQNATPRGTFPLGVVLTNQSVHNHQVHHRSVTPNTCIVDDPSSPYYNMICDQTTLPSGTSYEPSGANICQGQYNALIFIEHNGNGTSRDHVTVGRGSAITICGKNSRLTSTGGCIDISAEHMTRLLSLLDYSKKPHIEITYG